MLIKNLLIPGDPSLATSAEASVAETLGMTNQLGGKEGKEMAIRIEIITCSNISTNRHFFPSL